MNAPSMESQTGHIEVRDLDISFNARGAAVQAVKAVSLDVRPNCGMPTVESRNRPLTRSPKIGRQSRST